MTTISSTGPSKALYEPSNSTRESQILQDQTLYIEFFQSILPESICSTQSLKGKAATSLLTAFTDHNLNLDNKNLNINLPAFFSTNKLRNKYETISKSHATVVAQFINNHKKDGLARNLATISLIYGGTAGNVPILSSINKQDPKNQSIVQLNNIILQQVREAKKLNYFHPLTPFVEYLAKNYQGIDCSDMTQVRSAMHTLLRAKMLLEAGQPCSLIDLGLINSELERIKNYVIQYTEQQGESKATLDYIDEQLNIFESEDPFTEEFINSEVLKVNPMVLEKSKEIPNLAKLRNESLAIGEYYTPTGLKANLESIEGKAGRYIFFEVDQAKQQIMKQALLHNHLLQLTFFNFSDALLLVEAYNKDSTRSPNLRADLHYDEKEKITTINIH